MVMNDYKLETNGLTYYKGFLCIDDLTEYEQTILRRSSFVNEIGGKTYVLMGEFVKDSGTLVAEEEFAIYFEKYGNKLLTDEQYKQALEIEQLPLDDAVALQQEDAS